MQKLSFPALEGQNNCLIIAPTGSGKTEAAVLPVLKKIADSGNAEGITAIYITPLRALNRDMIKRLEWLAAGSGISIGVRHGDTPQSERKKQAASPPRFLITTPESLQNLFLSERLRAALKNVRFVIVDEVHELYSSKRGAQLSIALERVEELSAEFQRIGLSATVGKVDDACTFLFGRRKFRLVDTASQKSLNITIELPEKSGKADREFAERFGLDDAAFARIVRLAELIRGSNATLVFANTRQVVESLGNKLLNYDRLERFGPIGIHHSSIDKNERIEVENAFKEGRLKALLATSSLELGIDIGKIDLVVQYGSPRQVVRLLQRIGRAGHREHMAAVGRIIVSDPVECLESVAVVTAAKEREMEKQGIESMALDVLANQVCGIVLEYKKIDIAKMHSMISRAGPYLGLEAGKLMRIVSFLAELRIVNFDSGSVSMGARSRNYFIHNISVIPDTTRFLVKTVITNKLIASLDENFVHSYLDVGSTFITKGLAWKVVSIEEDKVYVEPTEDLEAALPDWEGEDLPVSFNVASRVFGLMHDESARKFLDQGTAGIINSFIEGQGRFFLPSNDIIYMEELENHALLYIALGRQANELLARAINMLIIPQVGAVVRARATPYAIIIDYSNSLRRVELDRLVALLSKFSISENTTVVEGSDLYRYKFVQIAKVFGIIEKKSNVTRSMTNRLVSFYKNSVVNDEVIRDLNKNYLDSVTVQRFLSGLRSGKIKAVEVRRSGSPLAMELLQAAYHHSELLSEVSSEREIEHMIRKFEGRGVKLLCMFCGQIFTTEISTSREKARHCPVCKSTMLVISDEEYSDVVRKRLSGRRLSGAEQRVFAEMNRQASLIQAYGDRALIALGSYGVGIETAARLLRNIRSNYRSFFVDVIKAQKDFVRNRKFWKARNL